MLRKATTFTTFCNTSREANLSSAKRALKRHRGAWIHRDTMGDDDVIDIVIGAEIIERHLCKKSHFVRYFRVEDLALYR